ncbi:MAG: HAD family hydrolase [Sphaerochaeta sp.]|jgi:putative hydrolase of the HAD superfamily|uniref:HAD family hydrolase n=1 Tax=Sphaerochaeta sp. TaxID=1972642 RepID=UPI002FC865AA
MGFLTEQGISVLCLDIDGTLYPKRMLNARMLRSSFPSLRLAFAFNWARAQYRRDQERVPTIPNTREGLLDRQARLVLSHLGQPAESGRLLRLRAQIDRQFYHAWERSFRTIQPFPGLREALLAAKQQNIRIAVFSDFPLAGKLQNLGIEDLVDQAYSAEESGYLKPSPLAFSYLLDRLAVDPDQVLFMGDSYQKDCQGAKRAGMYACLITRRAKTLHPDADLVVRSWKEFASLVL